ncbi:hypothetical protein BZA05DRAFT_411642 [Tricharina praecox]|uniref:uncharacterized protein n=1 Tax=Tricharina praecox TaxID=43433 RepID=UPI00221EE4F9|nr:uncharacterized protein BZA05DRAFT_411642 [Tricharina praecox]KAI5842849.1 hypothetical protein BZA05DRAFT_411642 [Tricharina praecox]
MAEMEMGSSSISPAKKRKRSYSSSSSSSRSSSSPDRTPARRPVVVSSSEDEDDVSEYKQSSSPPLPPPESAWGSGEDEHSSVISGSRRSEKIAGAEGDGDWDWGSVDGTDADADEDRNGDRTENMEWEDDAWGSVEPASDAEKQGEPAARVNGGGVGIATDDDWGSVEPTEDEDGDGDVTIVPDGGDDEESEESEDEERENVQHAQVSIDDQATADDDWGSVEAASDGEGRVQSEGAEDSGDEEDTGPALGRATDEEAYEAESEEEIYPHRRRRPVIHSPELSAEDDEDDDSTTSTSRSSRSRISQTSETSSPSPSPSPPPLSSKSRFIRNASQQFHESLDAESPPRVKGRRRGAQRNKFTTEYVDLLNTEIRAARDRSIYSTSDAFRRQGCYVLLSYWTPDEQDVFFNHLAVLRKDAVDGIAKAVGTKTVFECRAYIQLLEEGLLEVQGRRSVSRSRDTVGLGEIPAAVELSEDCVAALERQADFVEDRKRRDEERFEKRRWGDCWLIDEELAAEVKSLYKADDTEGINEIAPEAELLDVAKILDLSEKYFMNGSGESNYRAFAPRGETPSMRYTALQDLHSLVLSVTRRIVQTSIFMAESRLRNMENQIFAPAPFIRADDVQAAVEAMSLPQNTVQYWAQLPRRTGLAVVEHIIQMKYKVPKTMELTHVEEFLNKPITKVSGTKIRRKPQAPEANSNPPSEAEDSDASEAGSPTARSSFSSLDPDSSDLSDDDAMTTHPSAAHIRRTRKLALLAAAEDRYMNAIDARQSLREEKQLWRVMGFSPTTSADENEEEGDEGEVPNPLRRQVRDLECTTDWRDDVVYHAPWEVVKKFDTISWPEAEHTHQDALPDQPATPNRNRKRRRIQYSDDEEEEAEATPTDSSASDVEMPPAKKPRSKLQSQSQSQSQAQSQSRPKSKPKSKPKPAPPPPPPPVQRSPRKARNRRQSAAPVGFVNTVDALMDSDDGAAGDAVGGGEEPREYEYVAEYEEDEEGDDEYQEEEE